MPEKKNNISSFQLSKSIIILLKKMLCVCSYVYGNRVCRNHSTRWYYNHIFMPYISVIYIAGPMKTLISVTATTWVLVIYTTNPCCDVATYLSDVHPSWVGHTMTLSAAVLLGHIPGWPTLQWKCLHLNKFLSLAALEVDNFQCSQWQKFCQND